MPARNYRRNSGRDEVAWPCVSFRGSAEVVKRDVTARLESVSEKPIPRSSASGAAYSLRETRAGLPKRRAAGSTARSRVSRESGPGRRRSRRPSHRLEIPACPSACRLPVSRAPQFAPAILLLWVRPSLFSLEIAPQDDTTAPAATSASATPHTRRRNLRPLLPHFRRRACRSSSRPRLPLFFTSALAALLHVRACRSSSRPRLPLDVRCRRL